MDGCGRPWRSGAPDTPGVYHSVEPAWNDANLRELAGHISSPLFFTHIRAAIGSAVQQTNCHPFRHDNWLFMHNGYINEFGTMKRDVVLAIDPSLYPQIQGQADTEFLFYLALTFGLIDDPPAAVERAIGFVESVAARHGIPHPFQGTVATTDGESIWAFLYSSEGKSRSLFYTTDLPTLRKLYPELSSCTRQVSTKRRSSPAASRANRQDDDHFEGGFVVGRISRTSAASCSAPSPAVPVPVDA